MSAGRHRDMDADWATKRDARLIKAWNEGLTISALEGRFALSNGGVSAILRRAREAGQEVRSGRSEASA